MTWVIGLSLVFLLLSLGQIGLILFSKLPQLRVVNPASAGDRREAEVKHALFSRRLERESAHIAKKATAVVRVPWAALQTLFRTAAGRLVALERKYETARNSGAKKEEKLAIAKRLISEAARLAEAEDMVSAEKKLVEAVTLAPRYAEGYIALAELFVHKKAWEDAIEAWKYAASLAPKDPGPRYEAGLLLWERGDLSGASDWLEKALKLEESNPKYLSALIEVALEAKDKETAEKYIELLAEANPQNKKISLYREDATDLKKK